MILLSLGIAVNFIGVLLDGVFELFITGVVVAAFLGAAVLAVRDRRAGRPEPPRAERYRVGALMQAGLGLVVLFVAIRIGALEGRLFGLLYLVLAAGFFIAALVFYLLSRRAERAR